MTRIRRAAAEKAAEAAWKEVLGEDSTAERVTPLLTAMEPAMAAAGGVAARDP